MPILIEKDLFSVRELAVLLLVDESLQTEQLSISAILTDLEVAGSARLLCLGACSCVTQYYRIRLATAGLADCRDGAERHSSEQHERIALS